MNTFGTFLLAIAAFIGTLMIITSPIQRMMKWARGKKKSELEAEVKSWVADHDASEVIGKGCGFVFFFFLSIFYAFVVEPLAVISALVNDIGYQPLAYVMLAIVALSWLQFARAFTINKSRIPKETSVTTDGQLVEAEEEIKLPSPSWVLVRRVLFSLPTLYLWYLLLVVIGVL